MHRRGMIATVASVYIPMFKPELCLGGFFGTEMYVSMRLLFIQTWPAIIKQ